MDKWAIIFLFVLPFAGCQSEAQVATGSTVTFGPDLVVESGPLERLIVVDGNLYSPSTEPVVIQRIRWYWDYNISWVAEEGSLVKEGDAIVKLDPSTITKDLTEKEIELETEKLLLEEETIRALDDLAQAKADVETKKFDLQKQELLVTDNDSVSANEKKKQQLEVANARKNLRRAQDKVVNVERRNKRKVEVQKLKVKKAEEEVEEMKKGLDMMTLRAPRDGLLIFPLYSSNSGQQKARAGGGVRVNTVVAEVADPNDLIARVYVPEIDADAVVSGTKGTMALDIAPGDIYTGQVKTVAGVPSTPAEREGGSSNNPADNVRQFEVAFALDKLPKGAMPGMTVRVVLNPSTKEKVTRVPIEALVLKPVTETTDPGDLAKVPEEGGQAYVYKKSDNGWSWQAVEIGELSLSHAEIKSGLKPGDVVKSVVF